MRQLQKPTYLKTCFSQPRWRGSKSVTPRPRGKYRVTLHHTSTDSKLKTPYASRKVVGSACFSAMGYPRVVNGRSVVTPPYNSLNDPHLSQYYAKKFGQVSGTPLVTQRSRPMSGIHGTTRTDLLGNCQFVPYKVTVITGDQKAGGTDAKVYFAVQGTHGRLHKTHLSQHLQTDSVREESKGVRFTRNSVRTFLVKGPDFGEPVKMRVEHDGLEDRHSWYLEEVQLTNTVNNKSWHFVCRQWLSLYNSDCQLSRDLAPIVRSATKRQKTIYEIHVNTGDVRGGGTDANIFLTVFGEHGSTPKTKLENGQSSNFERGKSSAFKMQCHSLGKLKKIRIEHDNTGFGPGWFLDRVTMADTNNPEKVCYFNCGQWLARDEGDGEIKRDIAASDEPTVTPAAVRYTVKTQTGDKRGAGTDANVFVTIFGKDGDTGERRLDNSKNNFERKRIDQFVLESTYLGQLERVRISHDNSGFGPGWYLDKVIIEDPVAGESYEFPCYRWLAKDEDDGQISRELVSKQPGDNAEHVDSPPPGVPYHVHVTTGDKRNAGTDANVYIVMYGEDDNGHEVNSGKIQLDNNKRNFVRGRTDLFNVESVNNLCPLKKVVVGHDNKGIGAGWYLEKVVVECLSSGLSQVFLCNAWLDRSEGDGLIERELYELDNCRQMRKAKNVWFVCVWTTDIRGAGTDAQVMIQVYGDVGTTDVVLLGNETDNFEQGEVDKFKVELSDIGTPYKLRVEHDNANLFPGWHLDKIQLENVATKERFLFHCQRWLDRTEDDGEIVRELAAEGNGITPLPVVKYDVMVYTGKKRGAGTDANVCMTIFGERGDTGSRQLRSSKTNKNKFENGKVDQFHVEAVSLGNINRIRIGHDGTGPGAGWFLEKVEVKEGQQCYLFMCQRWLSRTEDDGQIVRDLTLDGTAPLLDTTSYHLAVKTGDYVSAGTDANVFVTLFGEHGDTGQYHLKQSENTGNKFERGRVDKFTIETTDVGKLERLHIGHDGSGPGAGWYLEEVIVDVPSRGERFIFLCNRWLAKSEDDGRIALDLYPQADMVLCDKKVPYQLSVHTGDVSGAGTDANVFIVMYGELGKSDTYWLGNQTNNFERGKVDVFKIEAEDVGELRKFRIGHDNKGFAAGWFLEKVIVTRQSGQNEQQENCVWEFQCQRWLSRSEDDKEIVRELLPKGEAFQNVHRYVVRVFTGDVSGAGTDSNVYLTLYGVDGDTGERWLRTSETNRNKFERKQEDVFTIEAADLGKLEKLKVRHDNSGLGADWFLDHIEVDNELAQTHTVFCCGRWLSKGHGDGQISRELVPERLGNMEVVDEFTNASVVGEAEQNVEIVATPAELMNKARKSVASLSSGTTYIISVKTGNQSGAGTDANVYIILFGETQDTGQIQLATSKFNRNKFERNQTDEFSVEAVNIGRVKKIKIGHDNKGGFAGWFLDHVNINTPLLGTRDVFPCNRWLDKGKDDGALERELYPDTEAQQEYIPYVKYEVTTYTSDLKGAGTDANVFVSLYGEKGHTGDLALVDTSKHKRKDCFERKSVDVCVVEGVDVGDHIEKIRIGHDGTGIGAGWHLDKVELHRLKGEGNGDRSRIFTFLCDRWLARDEDDREIVRELVPSLETIVKEDEARNQVKVHSVQRKDMLTVKQYKVHVFTGDVSGGGTDANVFLTVFGQLGDSGERKLLKSETHRNKFERNHEDIFTIEAADLGRLQKIRIRHDNSLMYSDWFLDRVVIHEISSAEDENCCQSTFHCERWLAKKKEDGKIDRELLEANYLQEVNSQTAVKDAHPNETLQETGPNVLGRNSSDARIGQPRVYSSRVPYEVTVVTGDALEAGTDAGIYMIVYGSTGSTQEVILEKQNDRYERGQTDRIKLELEDVGSLKKIRIWHDGKGQRPSWLLDTIMLKDLRTSQEWKFPCYKWLSKTHAEDKATLRDIPSLVEGQVTVERTSYKLEVHTADKRGAGTDANVFIVLFGENGDSGEMQLTKSDTHRNKFERNQTDIFHYDNLLSLGELTKIRIWHDNSGLGASWYLDSVDVTDEVTEKTYHFNCQRWLSKDEDDKSIFRELPCTQSSLVEESGLVHYEITVTTSDKKGSGTAYDMGLVIVGEKGRSKEFQTKNRIGNQRLLQCAQTDVFKFVSPPLGRLSELEVRLFNKDGNTIQPEEEESRDSSWHLHEIVVRDVKADDKYLFPCKSWLSVNSPSHTLVNTEFEEGRTGTLRGLHPISYEVSVVTGDEPRAGTDANVYITIFGSNGDTGKRPLTKRFRNLFERRQTDTFKLEALDLGKLTAVRIEHDNKGFGAGWLLDKVIVLDSDRQTSTEFPCGKWLDKKKGDGQICRSLLPH
ncbi:lipoxygenase homology domain-containing protein 1-like isoform X2 [Corticium candelabrum]|uniref:lipoxygenase homology domain-containing protein 1-like isoform X2 n=1 Tax=Corticium candelabrum TaxID=121492 RepID=UPI002E2559C5|nr:lipoxygenase homology domain-containing protein 1-like isoform X2 [Corticium candelabrum]